MQPEPAPQSFLVGEEQHRLRLDRFLRKASPELGRKQIDRLLRTGAVRVAGVPRDHRYFVKTGDRVEVRVDPAGETASPPVEIVVRTRHLLAVAKPPHLATNPVRQGEPSVLSRLREADDPDGSARPGIVHRLDRETSGLLLFSLTPEGHRLLEQAFRDRAIRKIYTALVAGRPRPRQGTIDRPLVRSSSGRMRIDPHGARAVTLYRTLVAKDEASLLEVEPRTGRTHQIRIHLASIGHPIAGDDLYGDPRGGLGAPRLWLHASRIEMPAELATSLEAPARIDCPLPADLLRHLQAIGVEIDRGYDARKT